MKIKYDNSERLEGVSDKQWREALDEVTAYLRWRLAGKTQRGAHSERELGMPALDYYQEEAVVKLIEGDWKWQERFTLGKQLEKIAADLVTKQTKKYKRLHPAWDEDAVQGSSTSEATKSSAGFKVQDSGGCRRPEFIELRDPERLPDCMDDDGQEELEETYNLVYGLVEDDEELTIFVSAIEHCGNFKDLPEHTGWEMKKVYRLMEKLMRRIRRFKELRNNGIRDLRNQGGMDEMDIDGKKGMKLIDKIYMFEAERKAAEESYNAFGVTREEHQERMLAFIHRKLEEQKTRMTTNLP